MVGLRRAAAQAGQEHVGPGGVDLPGSGNRRRAGDGAMWRVGGVGQAEVGKVLPGRVAEAVDDAADAGDDAAVGLVPPAQQLAGIPDAEVVDLHRLRRTGERPRSTVLSHEPDCKARGAAPTGRRARLGLV